ncbi:hypothetical protein [Hyphomicrobium sp. ghe19]|uniref:hypothetical protein n=1 Tax=Hyphomicrobium sp. ghe19 TaxID=2682968 RepID=UPI0030CB0308
MTVIRSRSAFSKTSFGGPLRRVLSQGRFRLPAGIGKAFGSNQSRPVTNLLFPFTN